MNKSRRTGWERRRAEIAEEELCKLTAERDALRKTYLAVVDYGVELRRQRDSAEAERDADRAKLREAERERDLAIAALSKLDAITDHAGGFHAAMLGPYRHNPAFVRARAVKALDGIRDVLEEGTREFVELRKTHNADRAKLDAIRQAVYEGGQNDTSRCVEVRRLLPYVPGCERTTTEREEPLGFAASLVRPGTPYPDEPGETITPGWWVTNDAEDCSWHAEVFIDQASDEDGNDIAEKVARRIAAALNTDPALARRVREGSPD